MHNIPTLKRSYKQCQFGSKLATGWLLGRKHVAAHKHYKGTKLNLHRFLCIDSFRYVMGHRPERQDVHLNDCQIHKLGSLRGSWRINKAVDYIKSLLKPPLLHATPSVETI